MEIERLLTNSYSLKENLDPVEWMRFNAPRIYKIRILI